MQLDLHCHTEASFDCRMTLDKVADLARARGLDAIAITDHNTFAAARDLPDEPIDGLHLIRGIEIGTERGDILGIFLQEGVATRDFHRAVDAIHEQGGLAILAHPFKWTRSVSADTLQRVDGIEVYNARGQGFTRWDSNALARHLWSMYPDLIPTAGSDSHLYREVGRGRIELDERAEGGAEAALRAHSNPRFRRDDSSALVETTSQFIKLAKQPGLKQFLRFGRHLARAGLWTLRGTGTEGPDMSPPLVEGPG